jgi:glycerate kinase
MERAGFAAAVESAGVCITAEGRIDRQTLSGKVVARVAAGCRAAGVDCIAVGGSVEPGAAAELARRGVHVHEQTDLRVAGRQVSNRYP